jgi:hypothetical protein
LSVFQNNETSGYIEKILDIIKEARIINNILGK